MSESQAWDEAAKRMVRELGGEPSCGECIYFQAEPVSQFSFRSKDSERQGTCRRHSPVAACHDHVSRTAYSVFPLVLEIDWCGEFLPREER